MTQRRSKGWYSDHLGMGADGDLCDLVHGPASRVQSELRGTRVHVARSAEPEPELEPELAKFRLFLVGLPVQGGSQGRRGELERAGRWREGLFRLTGIIQGAVHKGGSCTGGLGPFPSRHCHLSFIVVRASGFMLRMWIMAKFWLKRGH